MEVILSFVPPGGGATRFQLPFDLPGVPQAGDHISITRPGQYGSEDFVVRRTVWRLERVANPATDGAGRVASITVECEYAAGDQSSTEHKRAMRDYANRGRR